MKYMKGFTLIEAIICFIAVFGLLGWGQDVYKLTQCDFKAPYKAEVFYGIGAFVPPAGAIIGWININDEASR